MPTEKGLRADGCVPSKVPQMKSSRFFLPLFTLFLLTVNLIVFGYFGDYVSRIVRFASMFFFFLIALGPKYFKGSALVIFFAFVINDFLLIYFESSFNQNLVLFIRLCAYLLLARLVWPYLKKIKVEKFQGVVFGVILIFNLLLTYYLNDSINGESDSGYLENLLFYGYSISIILSVSIAFTFYNRYTDKTSVFFVIAVMALVMSDFTYFIGFYLGFREFYYLDRAFNIVAIGVLLHFLFLYKQKIADGCYNKTREIF